MGECPSNVSTADNYHITARMNVLRYWIFAANRFRIRPITVNQVKAIPFFQPQNTFDPCPETMLQIILMIFEHGKIEIQPHIILMFIRRDLIFFSDKWYCPFCPVYAKTKKLLYGHMNINHSTHPLKCLCGSHLESPKKAINHLMNCTRSTIYPSLSEDWTEVLRNSTRDQQSRLIELVPSV